MDESIKNHLTGAKEIALPENSKVFEAGDRCEQFFYLLQGTIRVDLITYAGKPLTLYRFSSGETCILTTSCLMSGDPYNAEAIVEEPVKALVIPIQKFESLIETSIDFRKFVFDSFSARLSALMLKIEDVSSVPIDQRMAIRVLELADDQNTIVTTHDQLAADIGTAREVVSRKLKLWENNGWIRRSRGSFSIVSKTDLKKVASKK